MSIEHSRATLLALGLTHADERTLKQRQEESLVTLRVDPTIAGAGLAARVLVCTLRRLPGRLALDRTGLSPGFVDCLVDAVAAIDSTRPLAVIDGLATDATVQLDIGVSGEPGFIRVVPDGYGVQLAGDPNVGLVISRPGNALGAVLAAAFAAAEAFKYIVVDKEERRTLHKHLRFCPVSLTDDLTVAPELTTSVALDIAVVGNGAIGTAIVLILSELRLGGRVVVCDPETYDRENRGTYSLGGEREVREKPDKVDVAADALEAAGYTTVKVADEVAELIRRVDAGELDPPAIMLTGLDTPEARRDAERLWPDHIIDAATGDTAVGLHHAVPEGPCVRCFFPERTDGPDPLERLSAETGLPVSRLRGGDEPLTEEDLAEVPPDKRERLRQFLGRPTCGLADAIGLTAADSDGYMPSVPFVSQMAACLAVGRLIAVLLGVETQQNFIQFDALHGPADKGDRRNPHPGCYCQERASVVRAVRARRWGNNSLSRKAS